MGPYRAADRAGPWFLERAAVWDRVGPVLGRDGYRVYALDVRGLGYTQRRGPYTLAGDVVQLSAFLSALHLDATHGGMATLLGHSSGAAIVGSWRGQSARADRGNRHVSSVLCTPWVVARSGGGGSSRTFAERRIFLLCGARFVEV